jgi:ketosteroid isomerase-like protein
VPSLLSPPARVRRAWLRYLADTRAAPSEAYVVNDRLTWALRKRDGCWKIVHEHTSAQADFDTGKVQLQR